MSTPRCQTQIERHSMLAIVTIVAPDGTTLVTTMDRYILPSDQRITRLKRQLLHRPSTTEEIEL